jgi:hypothetical protein
MVFSKNPYPQGYGLNMKDLYVQNPTKFYEARNTAEVLKSIFGRKRNG